MSIDNHISLQKGFTMLEALITVLVIAIGLLGVASLETLAMNNTIIARNRSLAAIQADGLASMMHTNTVYWQSGSVVSAPFTVTGTKLTDSTLNGISQNCMTSSCTAQQMAAYDLKDWGNSLASNLPSGTGTVSCVASFPVLCTIQVNWNETEISLNASTQNSAGTNQQNYQIAVEP